MALIVANDAFTQDALAADLTFQQRVASALATIAFQVFAEDPATANHAERKAYAQQVIANVPAQAARVAQWLVVRPNVNNFQTSYVGAWTTAAGDADLRSQINTDWNTLAGV